MKKKDEFVIHQKGTGLFVVSGSDYEPVFASFLVARGYTSVDSALDSAKRIQHHVESIETLQIIQVPDLTCIDADALNDADDLLETLSELSAKIAVLPEKHFRWLRNALEEARNSIECQLVFAGISLLEGVVPIIEVTRVTKIS
jgi:hypothetical protein